MILLVVAGGAAAVDEIRGCVVIITAERTR